MPGNLGQRSDRGIVRHVFATYAAIIQIVAMLLQCYSVAPHVSRTFLMPQCRGNHAECGCSPERIAAQTCCCYRHKPSCCNRHDGHEEEHSAEGGKGHSSPHLSAAPCGSSPKFIAASLDKLKFLRPDTLLPTPVGNFYSSFRSTSETAAGRFAEPPDPPPKLLITS